MQVSEDSLDRALRIAEAWVAAIEGLGWRIQTSDEDPKMSVLIDGEQIPVRFREKLSATKSRSPILGWIEHSYQPSKVLLFEVTDWRFSGARLQKCWQDSDSEKLEAKLSRFVETLPLYAAYLKRERTIEAEQREVIRLNHERYERRRKAEELKASYLRRKREELARAQSEEQTRRANLSQLASDWQESKRIRQFCKEVESEARYGTLDHIQAGAGDWLRWATRIADLKDPFKNGQLDYEITSTGHDSDLDCSLNPEQVDFPLPEELQAQIASLLDFESKSL
ncbi:hypothetical protein QEH52_11675 [Coraliomargarita sp. SDUM461003]|uniref:Uncharacterized protein n=1 Tax=Thalassobacterium maritimum TaxID=3041265 RepID=A0ABU1AX49_9BACT|nr:hypothetical protein [Coraliomargarita sp. SDUM461003]MDQ8208172.1 hypothetical protein [Coraliomargarita sp. SDUM461003]